jgi:hypothetical protein
MRKFVVATFVCLACVMPIMAQGVQAVSPVPEDLATPAPVPDANQQPKDAQNQQHREGVTAQLVEDGLRTRLAHAGFTDIEMIPTSFLVRAKDADGNSVMLVLSPDTVAEFKQRAPQDDQDDSAPTGVPLDQQKF